SGDLDGFDFLASYHSKAPPCFAAVVCFFTSFFSGDLDGFDFLASIIPRLPRVLRRWFVFYFLF
ncbi:MAG: hypothetical protein ACLTDS_10930, partial [Bianqueaceae bacterium]